ncbi:hypothetical protein BJ742DRAFT_777823 [Cladochytrium replicatum]|nr:hypothetical protein BJ742DRAFT_777823 [Cladochytrium replicatum]
MIPLKALAVVTFHSLQLFTGIMVTSAIHDQGTVLIAPSTTSSRVCLLWTDPPTDPSTTSLDFTKTSYELCGFGIFGSAATGIVVPALFAITNGLVLLGACGGFGRKEARRKRDEVEAERAAEEGASTRVKRTREGAPEQPKMRKGRRKWFVISTMAAISLLSAITMFAVSLDLSVGINKMCDAMVAVSGGPDTTSCDTALQLIAGKSLLTLKVAAVGAWALMGSWILYFVSDIINARRAKAKELHRQSSVSSYYGPRFGNPISHSGGADGGPATPPAASISMKEVKRTTKTPSFVSRQGTNVDLDMEDPFAIDDDVPWSQKPTSSANLMPPKWGPAGFTSKSQPQKWGPDAAGNKEEEMAKPGGTWGDNYKTPKQTREGGNWGDNYKKSSKSKESMSDPFADRNQINPFDDMDTST